MIAGFLRPGGGRLLSVPEIIGAFACFLLYPVIAVIVRSCYPDADKQEIRMKALRICTLLACVTIAVIYFIFL